MRFVLTVVRSVKSSRKLSISKAAILFDSCGCWFSDKSTGGQREEPHKGIGAGNGEVQVDGNGEGEGVKGYIIFNHSAKFRCKWVSTAGQENHSLV